MAIIDNLKHVIKQHTHNNENAKLWTYIYGEQTKGGIHSKIDVDKDAKPSSLGSIFSGNIKEDIKYSNRIYKKTKGKEMDTFVISNHFCKLYRHQSFVQLRIR